MNNTEISSSNVFIINRSKLDDRFDAGYYKEGLDFSNCIKLSKIAKISGGKRLPEGTDFSDEPTQYRYLRVGDINWDGTLNYSNLKYLTEEVYLILKRYEIFKNDLLIAIVGATVGKVSILNIETSEKIILTENCAKITLKGDNVLPEYISIILQSTFVQKQVQLNYIQTTLPKLGLDRVESIYIPKIPLLEKQHELVLLYNTAFSKKQVKETQAKLILKEIDSYLLTELGLTPNTSKDGIVDRIFIANFSEVVGLRFDPLYFKFYKTYLKSFLYDEVSLKSIAHITKGQSITKDRVEEGPYPVIAGGKSSPYNHNLYNQQPGVITVSASGAYAGYVWFHQQKIYASDCNVIRAKNDNQTSTEFIYNVLKAKQDEIYRMQQGAGQPHVYGRDLEKLQIPLPPLAKQIEINDYVSKMTNNIDALMKEAKLELNRVRLHIESIIYAK